MTAIALMPEQDEAAFAAVAERHRRELEVHCYRMMGSLEDAEDLVQETLLRAWRSRESFEGRASLRAWLYRIATNACLDALQRRPREALKGDAAAFEVPWLGPCPDDLLDAVVERETIELAFMVAIQQLPPKPRAVLILRDVLGWSAKETAALLETSVASVTSALQRARAALKEHLPQRRLEWHAGADPVAEEKALLERYIDATERGDAQMLAATLHEQARFAMPPQPETCSGRDAIVAAWVEGGFGSPEFGDFRCLLTRANRQPAVAGYVRGPGETEHRLLAIDVLGIADGAIAEVLTFYGDAVFDAFGLPRTI